MTTSPAYREQPEATKQAEATKAEALEQPPAYTPSHSLTPRSTMKHTDAAAATTTSNSVTVNTSQTVPKRASAFNRKFYSITSKAAWPLNKAANVIGAEGWWPTSMEKECGKAARILHSFTRPSLQLNTPEPPKADGPLRPTGLTKKSIVKIPESVPRNCAGLAIFNVIRAGALNASLTAGSGVVLARRLDGSWSPPSSFVVTTIGAGFAFGLYVYDCVCVLNTPVQISAFTNPRVSLGGDASIAVGPIGTGGSVDAAVSKTARPMWSYMKSRGLWTGVQIDGTIIVSRADANAVFYNEQGISAKKILRGNVAWPAAAKPLFEVLGAIEGRSDCDHTVVQEVGRIASPGDAVIDGKREVRLSTAHNDGDEDEWLLDEKERLARAGY